MRVLPFKLAASPPQAGVSQGGEQSTPAPTGRSTRKSPIPVPSCSLDSRFGRESGIPAGNRGRNPRFPIRPKSGIGDSPTRIPDLAENRRLCSKLNQGHQGVSGRIRNQDQGWGYQGSLISWSQASLHWLPRVPQRYQGYQESGSGMGVSGSLPDLPDSTQI